jgi:hypothetical protein
MTIIARRRRPSGRRRDDGAVAEPVINLTLRVVPSGPTFGVGLALRAKPSVSVACELALRAKTFGVGGKRVGPSGQTFGVGLALRAKTFGVGGKRVGPSGQTFGVSCKRVGPSGQNLRCGENPKKNHENLRCREKNMFVAHHKASVYVAYTTPYNSVMYSTGNFGLTVPAANGGQRHPPEIRCNGRCIMVPQPLSTSKELTLQAKPSVSVANKLGYIDI